MGSELTLGLAFLAGLAGAGHCWAMCGGLVGGLFLGCGRCSGVQGHAGYHIGRVLSYTAIGALAAGVGQAMVLTGGVGQGQGALYVLAGLTVVGAGAWVALHPQPAGEGRQTRGSAGWMPFLAAGLVNGLMPCALVYSLAVKAMTAPSVAQGAAWLFAFGLGTVPAMAVAGAMAHWLGVRAMIWLRRAAALLVIALGIQAVWAGAEFFRVMGRL